MDPIPLRTLTLLLNYERITSNPQYQGTYLLKSSFADASVLNFQPLEARCPEYFGPNASKSKEKSVHWFARSFHSEPPSKHAATTCTVHPDASEATKNLSAKELELIYHLSRGHDGCTHALRLFLAFFKLCPDGQSLSIQLENEKPVIVSVDDACVVEFTVMDSRAISILNVMEKPFSNDARYTSNMQMKVTGAGEGFPHKTLTLGTPGGIWYVDMSSMQFGNVGQGIYGEQYFMGRSLGDSQQAGKKYCEWLKPKVIGGLSDYCNRYSETYDKISEEAAKRVMGRWVNRDKEGGCEHCGVGGKLLDCSSCKKGGKLIRYVISLFRDVQDLKTCRYCSARHQKAGWKLHKHICLHNAKIAKGKDA